MLSNKVSWMINTNTSILESDLHKKDTTVSFLEFRIVSFQSYRFPNPVRDRWIELSLVEVKVNWPINHNENKEHGVLDQSLRKIELMRSKIAPCTMYEESKSHRQEFSLGKYFFLSSLSLFLLCKQKVDLKGFTFQKGRFLIT